MTTTTINDTDAIPSAHGSIGTKTQAPRRGFFGRVWDDFMAFGESRARSEIARHIRLHGGRPTGDLAQDSRQLAALRGLG